MTNKRTAMRVLTTITIEIMILQWKHLAQYDYEMKIIKIPNLINLLKRVEDHLLFILVNSKKSCQWTYNVTYVRIHDT